MNKCVKNVLQLDPWIDFISDVIMPIDFLEFPPIDIIIKGDSELILG